VEYDEQEAQRAVLQGFRTLWAVHETYVLEPHIVPLEARRIDVDSQRQVRELEQEKREEMVIVAKGEVARCYAPLLHPEVPNALAKIHYGDEAATLAFVQKYGLLGYGKLVPLPQHPSGGDPLPWFWTHAETVRLALEVASYLQQDDMEHLETYLQSLRSPYSYFDDATAWPSVFIASREQVVHMTWQSPRSNIVAVLTQTASPLSSEVLHAAVHLGRDMERTRPQKSLRDYGRAFLRDVVNPNIAGIHLKITEDEGYDRPCFVFHALCEMVYWHLVNPLGKLPLRRCANPHCQAPFFPKTAKQKYCPPPWGQSDSPCANRHRVNKWRRAHAEQDA
jgi:hypothetical protein